MHELKFRDSSHAHHMAIECRVGHRIHLWKDNPFLFLVNGTITFNVMWVYNSFIGINVPFIRTNSGQLKRTLRVLSNYLPRLPDAAQSDSSLVKVKCNQFSDHWNIVVHITF